MHRINNICTRLECAGQPAAINGKPYFLLGEYVINGIFTFELFLRIVVSGSIFEYLSDSMNWIDMFAVLPFYYSVFNAVKNGSTVFGIDFSILPSSPQPIFDTLVRSTKVLRLFKLMRSFRATEILTETANKSFYQISAMVGLLFLIVIVLAILLFEVEAGKPCYVGDPGPLGCKSIPSNIEFRVRVGDRIVIDKNGNLSNFSNVFFGVWFGFVTVTTTGYGDITPVTNGGQIMGIFLMMFGVLYMSMPLTAAASTFYEVHQRYVAKRKRVDELEKTLNQNLEQFKISHLTLGTKRKLIKMHDELEALLVQMFNYATNWRTGATLGAGMKKAANSKSFLLEKAQMLADNISSVLVKYKSEFTQLALFDAKKHQYWLELAKSGGALTQDNSGVHHHHNMFEKDSNAKRTVGA